MSTINRGDDYFAVVTYTGNGSSQSITGLRFQPDFVWIKGRSGATDHALYDAQRGVQKRLESNTTDAEATSDNGVTAFNSDGFSIGSLAQVNTNGATYVAWCWKESVSAGFDIVTYTFSTAGTNTINHSLGVAPKMIIMKDRTTGYNWDVYHASVGYTQRLILNSTGAATSGFWAAAPTSTQFSVTNTAYNNNDLVVAYLFAEVAGFSKFGSYTGNGSSDGPFLYLGFKPAFILVKSTTEVDSWRMYDRSRLGYNPNNSVLYPNLSNAEGASTDHFDLVSNGAKIRSNNNNTSGQTYIYAAFAENPFKNSLAR